MKKTIILSVMLALLIGLVPLPLGSSTDEAFDYTITATGTEDVVVAYPGISIGPSRMTPGS